MEKEHLNQQKKKFYLEEHGKVSEMQGLNKKSQEINKVMQCGDHLID